MTRQIQEPTARYALVAPEKAGGATYTPKPLADFVASAILSLADLRPGQTLRVLDPAVGEGELLASLLEHIPKDRLVEVHGFETDAGALQHAHARLAAAFPHASIDLTNGDFLRFVLDSSGGGCSGGLFDSIVPEPYDLIIANPPYVRTQILGANHARTLANRFGLKGRVDLYHAFILAMAKVLAPHGAAGIITSNRFMTTRAGASVRQAIRAGFRLRHVWDLGDTKLFDAAVLPAVLLAEGRHAKTLRAGFTSIYETREPADHRAQSVIAALRKEGVVELPGARKFRVRHGTLDESGGPGAVWRIANQETDAWLSTVAAQTWRTFGQIGKVRVGVKTCADDIFIGTHWYQSAPEDRPELLRPLITHHMACPFRALESARQRLILYPHETVQGRRRPAPLGDYPRTRAYLEKHRAALEARKYVLDAGRQWYEIWVPQDPLAWSKPKLVFRDISERPCFWIDLRGAIVNGDCYWMTADRKEDHDVLWLAAAVGNSTFIEAFYDHRFNNKLYAGRRRFITQYVEGFPLPDPRTKLARAIVAAAKTIYESPESESGQQLLSEVDRMVWESFGLGVEEVAR